LEDLDVLNLKLLLINSGLWNMKLKRNIEIA